MTYRASVIVPARNEGLNLFLTVQTVDQTSDVEHEIIVVDDGSTDGSTEFLLSAAQPHHRLVHTPGVGPSRARNVGASLARSEVLVFLDGHCFPDRNWLSPLVDAVRRHPNGMFTGRISYAGSYCRCGYGLTLTTHAFSAEWLPPAPPFADVPLAGAALMAVGTDRYFSIGGFYPFRAIGFEDVELSIRQWLFGGTIQLLPEVNVFHVFAGPGRPAARRFEYTFNGLTTAYLNLSGEHLEKSVRAFDAPPAEAKQLRELLRRRGVFDDAERFARRRTMEFSDYCRKFAIEW